jgi:hypothetical protein
MRYFELIESEVTSKETAAAVSCSRRKTKLTRIPAGAGPVQVYIRDGKVFVVSDQPLERVTLP